MRGSDSRLRWSVRWSACILALGGGLSPSLGYAQRPQPTESPARLQIFIRAAGNAVPGALVRLDTIARISDDTGRVLLLSDPGLKTLHVTAIGYQPLDTTFIVTGRPLDVSVRLRPTGVLLDSVHVTAQGIAFKPARYKDTGRFDEFYARKARALGGRFLTREDIERSDRSRAVDLLASVPGVRAEHTTSVTPFSDSLAAVALNSLA